MPPLQEITVAPETTDVRGAVIAVGKPRLQLSTDGSGSVEVSDLGKVIAADVPRAIDVWDLATGTHLHHVEAPDDRGMLDESLEFSLSPDGTWIAAGDSSLSLLHAPFGKPAFNLPLVRPISFSPDSRLLLVDGPESAIVDLAQQKIRWSWLRMDRAVTR